MALGVVVLAAVPVWVWATLIMAAFAALTVFTMWLARIPTLGPPPGESDQANGRNAGSDRDVDSDGA